MTLRPRCRGIFVRCETCWCEYEIERGQYNHRIKIGCKRSFCSQRCTGLSRWRGRPMSERRTLKATYDKLYRLRDPQGMKERKRLYHCMTYNPVEAAKARKKGAAKHAEYIRRYYADPTNKAAKVAYDAARRDAEYGDFADAARLLLDLQREIIQRSPDKYERLKARGYYDRPRIQERRRYS